MLFSFFLFFFTFILIILGEGVTLALVPLYLLDFRWGEFIFKGSLKCRRFLGEKLAASTWRVYRWQIFRVRSTFSPSPSAFGLPGQPGTGFLLGLSQVSARPGLSARAGAQPALGDLWGQAAVLFTHLSGFPQKGLSRL